MFSGSAWVECWSLCTEVPCVKVSRIYRDWNVQNYGIYSLRNILKCIGHISSLIWLLRLRPDPKKQCCERDTTVHKYSQLFFFFFFHFCFLKKFISPKSVKQLSQRRRSLLALLGGTVVWGDERPETGRRLGTLDFFDSVFVVFRDVF